MERVDQDNRILETGTSQDGRHNDPGGQMVLS